MTPDNWKLVLAFGGLFLTTVTGPILWMLRAESKRISAELQSLRSDVKADMTTMESRLEKQMLEMEARLNQRIDTRLVHR